MRWTLFSFLLCEKIDASKVLKELRHAIMDASFHPRMSVPEERFCFMFAVSDNALWTNIILSPFEVLLNVEYAMHLICAPLKPQNDAL